MIDLVALPPRTDLAGRACPLAAVFDDARLLGHVSEVAPLVWWWRSLFMLHFAPAAGPSQRDCVDVLLRRADRPPPPRRGIPAVLRIVHAEGPPDADLP